MDEQTTPRMNLWMPQKMGRTKKPTPRQGSMKANDPNEESKQLWPALVKSKLANGGQLRPMVVNGEKP